MIRIRKPQQTELAPLSALCLRSKAVWGYDEAFMAACRDELTLLPDELRCTHLRLAEDAGGLVGLVQVRMDGHEAELSKLFVEPLRLRSGIGGLLFNRAVAIARSLGARRMTIDADPEAAEFYRRRGALDAGSALSGSIPGRVLPRLRLDLGP